MPQRTRTDRSTNKTAAVNRLMRAHMGMITSTAAPKRDWLDLATVMPGMGLKLDRFEPIIPHGRWWQLRHLLIPDPIIDTLPTVVVGGPHSHPDAGNRASHSHTPHVHAVPRHFRLNPIRPGDRVLVAFVNDPIMPIVLGVIDSVQAG